MKKKHNWVEFDRSRETGVFELYYPTEQLWVCSPCGTAIGGCYGLERAVNESSAPSDYFDCTDEKLINFLHGT